MRLLLDTHIALWAILDDARLSDVARTLIQDASNELSVSVATLWEIAIKYSLRRGRAADMPTGAVEAQRHFTEAGYDLLAITSKHIQALEGLPGLHRDPFDRLLVAQALSDPLWLVTHDKMLSDYGPLVLIV